VKFGIGQPVARKEDPRLVTGQGRFTDDVHLPDELHLAVARSPYAHGDIVSLDISAAVSAPGVLLVLTAEDLRELGGLPCRAVLKDRSGNDCFIPHRPVLADSKVLFSGQAVAAVVAETRQAARDAAELIELQVDELPVVADLREAGSPDAAVLHTSHGNNKCFHYENGDAAAFREAADSAARLVEIDIINNRVAPSPLEPRASVGVFEDGRFTLHNPSQGAFAQQGVLANAIFKVPMEQVRVISGDTGGGFGIRGEVHPEAVLCLFAARVLGRPVKWLGDRSEMFLSDSHGRDNLTKATMALSMDGDILGVRIETLANLGAFCSAVGPFVPTMAGGRITGTVYRFPALYHSVRCLFTNTMPVAAYRGAGRPESCYVMERLIEAAAYALDMDAVALRKRNFIQPVDMPFENHSGVTIFSGNFAETLDMALLKADWSGFASRKRASELMGRLRGIGIGYYIESSGGGPEEEATVTIRPDGRVDVVVGTFSHGQGHTTTYSQILSETLGVDFDRINIIQGDTDLVKFGGGTGGSRSSQMGGIAVKQSGERVVLKGQEVAAELLQTDVARVLFEAGVYRAEGGEAGGPEVSLAEVARAIEEMDGGTLSETHRYNRGGGYTFPNGAHIAEVEIDPETGVVEVLGYVAVDDCGRVINPLLAGGQVHGGVVQGLGQALLEHARYDDYGQLVTGSLMDYAMPRASQAPDIDVEFNEVLDPNNELGVKGIGEGGACGAPPALVNAVIDALREFGIQHVDMPMTSESIWRLVEQARDN
jgi:carbon-monoxide dehydrogenase large subunit